MTTTQAQGAAGTLANVSPGEPVVVGDSQTWREICSRAEHVAPGDAKVLITGESGVGKSLIARLIHRRSLRDGASFVAVSCGGLTETLWESELFGHAKGSVTDAPRGKVGKLQQAHGGTLFLDNVGEMSLGVQAMLLRFLENGEIQPVDADLQKVQVDVRIIAATNRNLSDEVAAGRFREDLLYLLDVVHIHVPPLRERQPDIRALVEHILAANPRGVRFTEEAIRALEAHRWPGNVRELQNVVERLAWTIRGTVIDVADLPSHIKPGRLDSILPARERRRQRADDLFAAITAGSLGFWDHVHSLFLDRDITRHDMRELVRRGLAASHGNYRAVVRLFGMPDDDYKRFLNFLGTHDCVVDFRPYRRAFNGGACGTEHRPHEPGASESPGRRRNRDAS